MTLNLFWMSSIVDEYLDVSAQILQVSGFQRIFDQGSRGPFEFPEAVWCYSNQWPMTEALYGYVRFLILFLVVDRLWLIVVESWRFSSVHHCRSRVDRRHWSFVDRRCERINQRSTRLIVGVDRAGWSTCSEWNLCPDAELPAGRIRPYLGNP